MSRVMPITLSGSPHRNVLASLQRQGVLESGIANVQDRVMANPNTSNLFSHFLLNTLYGLNKTFIQFWIDRVKDNHKLLKDANELASPGK